MFKNILIVTKVDVYGITRNYRSLSFTTLETIKDEADIENLIIFEIFSNVIIIL